MTPLGTLTNAMRRRSARSATMGAVLANGCAFLFVNVVLRWLIVRWEIPFRPVSGSALEGELTQQNRALLASCVSRGDMARPLRGLKVLDLGNFLAGPIVSMHLAAMGADVIKVERITGDDSRAIGPMAADGEAVELTVVPWLAVPPEPTKEAPRFACHVPAPCAGESSYFMSVNRGKRSVAVDTRSDSGKEVLKCLVRRSDVLVENFRPGVMERRGVGTTVRRATRARLPPACCTDRRHWAAGAPRYVHRTRIGRGRAVRTAYRGTAGSASAMMCLPRRTQGSCTPPSPVSARTAHTRGGPPSTRCSRRPHYLYTLNVYVSTLLRAAPGGYTTHYTKYTRNTLLQAAILTIPSVLTILSVLAAPGGGTNYTKYTLLQALC